MELFVSKLDHSWKSLFTLVFKSQQDNANRVMNGREQLSVYITSISVVSSATLPHGQEMLVSNKDTDVIAI